MQKEEDGLRKIWFDLLMNMSDLMFEYLDLRVREHLKITEEIMPLLLKPDAIQGVFSSGFHNRG